MLIGVLQTWYLLIRYGFSPEVDKDIRMVPEEKYFEQCRKFVKKFLSWLKYIAEFEF